MGNWLRGTAFVSGFFIMAGPVSVLSEKLKIWAWFTFTSECGNRLGLPLQEAVLSARWCPSTCWFLVQGAESTLTQAGMIGAESGVDPELTKPEDFSERQTDKSENSLFFPRVTGSERCLWMEAFWHYLSRLQLTGESKIPRTMKSWDSDHWHVSNLQAPLIDTHCVQFCNWL